MGLVVLAGSLIAGPPGSGSGVFPSSSFADALQLSGGTQGKPFQSSGSSVSRTINSPAAFIAIPDVGATGDVAKADTLYFKSDSPVTLELTQDDGLGGSQVAVVPAFGLVILEFPSTQQLTGLRVKGSARCTYFVSGPA